jgi:hypothetical protein
VTTLERVLASVVAAALEALDARDHRHAVEVLLAVQEDAGRVRRLCCPVCGMTFPWPGARDQHLLVVHPEVEAAA